jgi:hypothetical protein
MFRPLLLAATAALAAACAVAAPTRAGAARACAGYTYAGVIGAQSRFGVSAKITPLASPAVRAGHVAAWVGVGGVGLGPGGTDEWLQVGISAVPGAGIALYYELAEPGADPRYVMLKGHLPVGRSHRLAVLESRRQRGSWSIWVDGTRVTPEIPLPRSHGAWRPVATTESWDGGVGACNAFVFRFDHVAAAARPGGSWSPLAATVIDAPGLSVTRQGAGFVARTAR